MADNLFKPWMIVDWKKKKKKNPKLAAMKPLNQGAPVLRSGSRFGILSENSGGIFEGEVYGANLGRGGEEGCL